MKDNIKIDILSKYMIQKGYTSVYYAGGTLCIDFQDTDAKGNNFTNTCLINISTETYSIYENGRGINKLMSIPMLHIAFLCYLETKGKNEYYMKCYDKSCIRHLYDCDMNKIDSINNEKEFFYDYQNDSFELRTKN